MRRWFARGAWLAVLTLAAETALGIHGHWPVGTALLLGIAGSLLLAIGAKALGRAGLQRPESGEADEDHA
jgi:hypothetical protein